MPGSSNALSSDMPLTTPGVIPFDPRYRECCRADRLPYLPRPDKPGGRGHQRAWNCWRCPVWGTARNCPWSTVRPRMQARGSVCFRLAFRHRKRRTDAPGMTNSGAIFSDHYSDGRLAGHNSSPHRRRAAQRSPRRLSSRFSAWSNPCPSVVTIDITSNKAMTWTVHGTSDRIKERTRRCGTGFAGLRPRLRIWRLRMCSTFC